MICRRKVRSPSASIAGSPVGCSTLREATIRGDPTMAATCFIEQICTVAIPTRSISFASAAPQRVLVPQVEVRIMACTPSASNRRAISRPTFFALVSDIDNPAVA